MTIQQVHDAAAFVGRLMSPAEVSAAVLKRTGAEKTMQGWFLCGDTTRKGFDSFALREQGGFRVSTFVGPSEGIYAVVTHQAGEVQHRFLLSMSEPTVQDFFKSLAQEPLQVMLGREGEQKALIVKESLEPEWVRPLLDIQVTEAIERGAYLAEFMLAVRAVCALPFIPSVTGAAIRELSVSVVPPESVAQWMLANFCPRSTEALQ